MKYIIEDGMETIRISDHIGDKILVGLMFIGGLVYSLAFVHTTFYEGNLFVMALGLIFLVSTLLMFFKLITKFEVVFDKKRSKVIVKTKSIIKCLESTRTINFIDIRNLGIQHTTYPESDCWSISLITDQEEYINIYDEVELEVKKLGKDISKLIGKDILYL